MDRFLTYYFDVLTKFSKRSDVNEGIVRKFINELESLPRFQCFDFIRLMLENNYQYIDAFELLWYKSMMNFVGTAKTTKDVILKLALTDLLDLYGAKNLLPIMLKLDRIKLEEQNNEKVDYNSIIKILSESDLKICNLVASDLNTFLGRWELIAKQLID